MSSVGRRSLASVYTKQLNPARQYRRSNTDPLPYKIFTVHVYGNLVSLGKQFFLCIFPVSVLQQEIAVCRQCYFCMQNIRIIRSLNQHPDVFHVCFSGLENTADHAILPDKIRIGIAKGQIRERAHGKLPIQTISFIILCQRNSAPAFDLDAVFIR